MGLVTDIKAVLVWAFVAIIKSNLKSQPASQMQLLWLTARINECFTERQLFPFKVEPHLQGDW